MGWSKAYTGGGCTAWERAVGKDHHVLVTYEHDARAPNEDEACLVGLYGPEEGAESEEPIAAAYFVSWRVAKLVLEAFEGEPAESLAVVLKAIDADDDGHGI